MLIFLDIDGVMIPAKPWKAPMFLQDGFPAFSSKATYVLQQLIAAGGTIMLTTSHKSKYTIGEWKRIFRNRNIIVDQLEKLDDNINHLDRRQEIEHWFHINMNSDHFVIFDDDKSLNDLPEYLKRKLILTESMIGLTDVHLSQAKQAAAIPLERA